MKKIISFVLCICMMMTLSAPVFASDDVMVVTYYSEEVEYNDGYSEFHKGWTEAIKKSKNLDYQQVKVTLLTDWLSDKNGQFTPDFWNDEGFNWDAIDFPNGSEITVDLNGFKIDRKLKDWEYNGEVMYINSGANVTIMNGSISGGYSCNGGGGIHMSGGNLFLENVNIVNNRVEDDDGAGIALHGGTLIMNGGSIKYNTADLAWASNFGGGISVFGGSAILTNVEISDNVSAGVTNCTLGGGVFVGGNGKLELNDCVLKNNTCGGEGGAISQDGGTLTITGCTIADNYSDFHGGAVYGKKGTCTIYESNISNNNSKLSGTSIFCVNTQMKIDSSFVDGKIKDDDNNISWVNRLESAEALSGSIINGGNLLIVAGVAAVIVIAAVVFTKKKKTSVSE